MRALAVGTVVACHAGVPGLAGGFIGVDLFFVISGFLITGLLLAEAEKDQRVSLLGFWARRARRILPASTVVLAATGLASALILPVLQRPTVSVDLVWSALFGANWRFAQQQTDYLAQDRAESPVLHYWSLAVEEQFYLVWPLVVAVAVAVFAGRRVSARLVLGVTTALIVVASFGYAVHLTAVNQPFAYFGTPARAWQLGAGALLAIASPLLRKLRPVATNSMATLGLAGYMWSVVSLRETGGTTPYPGWLALVPTVAAVLLVASGSGPRLPVVGRILSVRPLQVIGDLSYAWYLWHFPFLVLGHVWFADRAGPLVTTALVVASLGAAWLTFRYIEAPIRRLPTLVVSSRRSLQLGAALVACAVTTGAFAPSLGSNPTTTVASEDGRVVTLRPAPADAAGDAVSMRATGCDLDFEEVEPPACDFGQADSDKRVILLGDSHAAMMFPPLERAAQKHGWWLTSWTKSACPVADVTKYDESRAREFRECDEFRTKILRRIIEANPDVVFVASAVTPDRRVIDRASGELLEPGPSRRLIQAGLRKSVRQLVAAGIQVIVMVDPPSAPFNPPACLAEAESVTECEFPRPELRNTERRALTGIGGVSFLDFTKQICATETCTPVRGNILMYRDTAHITKTYAMTLTDRIASLHDLVLLHDDGTTAAVADPQPAH
ncbi:SGNH hydrolase domain-containing protein [Nocardioides speluncae]|uniref:SGNH hydrolase domain-containing protein n=1 Tax=Nocardioides speluncae TaxID=2670337 RepID=UPI00137A1B3D